MLITPVIWSPRAQRDLALIREHIAADRPMAAAAFADRLSEAGERLSQFPERGRMQGRSRVLTTVPPYLIRYRLRAEGVIILGVRHGARRT